MPTKNKVLQARLSNEHYYRNKEDIIRKNIIRRNKIKDFFNNLKKAPCTDCKIEYDPFVMEFDHLGDEKKEGNISQMVGRGVSVPVILKEIKKCELVCSNCHRLRHLKRRKNAGLSVEV